MNNETIKQVYDKKYHGKSKKSIIGAFKKLDKKYSINGLPKDEIMELIYLENKVSGVY